MDSTPQAPLAQLAARAAHGDEGARDEILRATLPRVRGLVHRQLEQDFRRHHRWILPLFSTGDIVQEVLVGVVRDLGQVELDGDDGFVRYLSTLVRHRLVDAVRHHEAARRDRRRHADQSEADHARGHTAEPPPAHAAALAEQVREFQDVLQSFSERHRMLLELRLRDGETYAVIAEKLGYASEETTRQAFVDAHARMLLKLRARGVRGSSS